MDFSIQDNLSIQVARYLTERIISGELNAGARIQEAPLAASLGVSRAPVREAFQILRRNRLIELNPRRGARVAPISARYIEWLYEVLVELYSIIVRKLILRPDDARLTRFDAALDKIVMVSRRGDERAYFDARIEYALIGLEGCDNLLLKETLVDFIPSIMRVQHLALKKRLSDIGKTISLLNVFNAAMRSGDARRGVKAIRDLLENDKKFALRAIADEG